MPRQVFTLLRCTRQASSVPDLNGVRQATIAQGAPDGLRKKFSTPRNKRGSRSVEIE
jgi:hypothetical protein